MDTQRPDHKALAQQILEMAENDRLAFVTERLSERTLSKTIRDLNDLMASGTAGDREIARRAVQSLGFVSS